MARPPGNATAFWHLTRVVEACQSPLRAWQVAYALGVSQRTATRHLATLYKAGLLEAIEGEPVTGATGATIWYLATVRVITRDPDELAAIKGAPLPPNARGPFRSP